MILGRTSFLTAKRVVGTWWRAVPAAFSGAPLATAHSASIPSRFNPASVGFAAFETLYLGSEKLVCEFEVGAKLGSPLPGKAYLPSPKGSWAYFTVDVDLRRVADLTAPSQRSLVNTTVQELTGDWEGYGLRSPVPKLKGFFARRFRTNVPTQQLGSALNLLGRFEGAITYSARVPNKKCLVVFPTSLLAGSSLIARDSTTGVVVQKVS